jgi:hypothetical protein
MGDSNVKDRMMKEIGQCSKLWEHDEHYEAVRNFLRKKDEID